ncbi:MAG: hypothetical protein NVS3B26_10020 [Mycobacteriales bacterium]
MTSAADHERFAELAAGQALRALEPGDDQVFRTHLAGCAECRAAVATHTDTLGHLAYAVVSTELPSAILAGIRAQIGEPVVISSTAVAAPVDLGAARVRRRRPTLDARSLVGAAAVAAMVLSLGIWNVALHREKSQQDVRAEQLAAAVSTLAGGAKHQVQLTDARGLPVAIAVVRADDTVSLVVEGMAPNNPSSSTYVLWQKGEYGVVRAVATFDVRGKGIAVLKKLPLARDVMGVEGFAVTRERGRTAPTHPGGSPVADGVLIT